MLGISSSLVKGGASLLTFVKDNLKLYLDFNSKKSDTLKFPSEGSTFFDGSDDFIDCGNNSSLQFSGSFSIGCWFKTTDATATNEILVSQANDGTNDSWLIRLNSSRKLEFEIYRGGSILITDSGSASNDGNWHHVVAVHESGIGNKLYKNGSLVASNSTGTDLTEHVPNFHIGNQDHSTVRAINADICNVFAYSRALTPEEIQSIQNKSYSQLKGVEKTSLVMWQSLDSASNGVVQPATGETLGTNLFTDSTFDLSGTQSASTTGTHWTTGSAWTIANGEAIYDATAHENRLELPSATFQNAGLYKFSFTVSDANTKAGIKIKAGGNDIIATNYYDNGDHVIYYNHASAYGSAKTLKIEGRNDVHGAFKLQNASWELVTSNTGFVTGATTTTSVYGGNAPILPRAVDVAKEGQADNIGNGSASFDGSSDRISFSPLSITGDASFTISAWIKPNTILGGNTIVVFGDDDTTDSAKRVALYFNAGKPYFAFWGSDVLHNSSVIQANEWQHFAITYSGGNTTIANSAIYLNGVSLSLTGGTASPLLLENDIFQIGADHNPSQYFDGLISQVGIWRGALTQSQIQSVFESTSYSKIPADVKSTLGSSEITSASNTTFSGVTSNDWTSSGATKSFSNNQMVFTMDGDSPAVVAQLSASNFAGGSGIPQKFLKVTLDVDSTTTGSYRINNAGGSCSADVFLKSPLTTGINTIYGVCDGASSYFRIFEVDVSTGDKLVLNSFDVQEVTNDLVAYYPLDANFRDSTNSKNDGLKGVKFTSNATRLRVPHHSDFDVEDGEGFAAGGWIKVNTYNDSRWLIGKGTGSYSPTSTNGWSIASASSPANWYYHIKSGGSNSENAHSTGSGNVGNWIFLGIGRDNDGQGYKLTSSGRTNGGSKAGALTNTSAIYIGASQSGNAIVSEIQQVFYFNRTITQAESLELYNNGNPLRFEDLSSSLKSACKLWLPLEGDLNDVSGNGHNAEGW